MGFLDSIYGPTVLERLTTSLTVHDSHLDMIHTWMTPVALITMTVLCLSLISERMLLLPRVAKAAWDKTRQGRDMS